MGRQARRRRVRQGPRPRLRMHGDGRDARPLVVGTGPARQRDPGPHVHVGPAGRRGVCLVHAPVPRGGPAERRDVAGRRRRAGRGVPSARCGRPVRSRQRSRRIAEGRRRPAEASKPDACGQGRRGRRRGAGETPCRPRRREGPPTGSVGQGRLRRRAGTSRGTPAERRDGRRNGFAVGGGASGPGLVRRAGRGRRNERCAGGDRGSPPGGQDRRLRVQLRSRRHGHGRHAGQVLPREPRRLHRPDRGPRGPAGRQHQRGQGRVVPPRVSQARRDGVARHDGLRRDRQRRPDHRCRRRHARTAGAA